MTTAEQVPVVIQLVAFAAGMVAAAAFTSIVTKVFGEW